MEEQLKVKLMQCQAELANVVTELAAELKNLKAKNVSTDFIQRKQAQLNTLIEYNNTIDDLQHVQKLRLFALKIENAELWKMIDQCVRSNATAFETLMKSLSKSSFYRK